MLPSAACAQRGQEGAPVENKEMRNMKWNQIQKNNLFKGELRELYQPDNRE